MMSTKVECGVVQKLLVTEVTEAGKMFVQLDTPEAYQVQDLSREIETHVSERNETLTNFEPGSQCYAQASDGVLYRALLVNLTTSTSANVYFVDYGNSEEVETSKIFPPTGNFFELPTQALCCTLGDFIPAQSKWSDATYSFLVENLLNQEVYGMFRSPSSNDHPYKDAVLQDTDGYPCYNVTLYQDETAEVSYSQLLVATGLGQQAICSESVRVGQSDKVFVAFSDSPGCFWLQFSSSTETLDSISTSLSDTTVISTLPSLAQDAIFPGVACCTLFVDDGAYYRAQVIEVGRGGKVKVQFVDYGNSTTVSTGDLFALPPSLCSIPAQAIQCCLDGVRPMKKDWTPESCEVFTNETVNIKLDAQFVDEFTPEVFNVVLCNPENGQTVSELLISSGCAKSSNPTPLISESPPTKLIQAAPQTTPPTALPTDYTTLTMEVGRTYEVSVPFLESPSVVWGQLIKYQSEFTSMMSKMALIFKNASAIPGLKDPAPGQPCAAQYPEDKQWYRCKIEAIDKPSKRAQVQFVDFGNAEIFTLSSLKQLPAELLKLPSQAVSFSMHALTPSDGGQVWSSETMSSIFKMTSSARVLQCNVVELDGDGYPAVRLRDSQERDVGEQLVRSKLARWKEEERKSRSYQQSRPSKDASTRGSGSRDSSTRGSGSRDSSTRGKDDSPRGSESRDSSRTTLPTQPLPRSLRHQTNPEQSSYPSKALSPIHTGTGPAPQPKSHHFSTQQLEVGQKHKVTVVFVESLQDFYVQLSSQAPLLETLMDDIGTHCSSDAARLPAQLEIGMPVLAQFTDDQEWYRAVITDRPSRGVYGVTFVDYGNKDTLQASSLIEMSPSFLSLPAQAVHCSLDGVGVQVSPEAAKTTFTDLTLEQDADGEVRSVLNDSNGPVYTIDLTLTDGTKPISALVDGGHISIPRSTLSNLTSTSSPTLTKIRHPTFPTHTDVDVCVSYAESPANFFVQLFKSTSDIDKLAESMDDVYSKMTQRDEVLFSLNTGVFCAAKFSEDGVWYRAQIVDVGGGSARVWFVDYGNEDTVAASDLKTLRVQFAAETSLAIRCTLDGVRSEVIQSAEVVQKFQESVLNKNLVAKFLKPFNSYSEPVPIQLCDTSKTGFEQDVAVMLEKFYVSIGQVQSQNGSATTEHVPSTFGATHSKMVVPHPNPQLNQPLICTVTHVDSPVSLYCQLVTSTTPAEDMLNELYTFYAEEDAGKALDCIEIGTVCAAPFSDGSWYRAKITSVNSDLVTVQYIDYGNSAEVKRSDLRGLDTKFATDPPHALRSSLNGIRPMGNQGEWSAECCERVSQALLDQECQVTILEGKDDAFTVQLVVTDNDFSQVLMRDGLAVGSESCESTTKTAAKVSGSLTIPPFSSQVGGEMDVFVTFCESPLSLYCQRTETDTQFAQLTDDIQQYCTSESARSVNINDIIIGDVILAQYSEDLAWYRGQIVGILEDGKSLKVLFVDYGNVEVMSSLRSIPVKFCSLAAQSVPCSLQGGEEYSVCTEAESENSFNDTLTGDESGFRLRFVEVGAAGEKAVIELTHLSDGSGVLQGACDAGLLVKKKSAHYAPSEHQERDEAPSEMRGGGGGGREDGVGDSSGGVLSVPGGSEPSEGVTSGGAPGKSVTSDSKQSVISTVAAGFLPAVMATDTIEDGFVSHFESPSSFWVQLACNESELESLIERLAALYTDAARLAKLDMPHPKPGQVCCAQFSTDQQWYRGIVDVVDDNGVRVHFVDYGNGELIPPDRVKRLEQEFLDIPVQAVHCSLRSISSPTGPVWPDGSTAYFSGIVLDNTVTANFVSESSLGAWLVNLTCDNKDVATAMIKEGVAVLGTVPDGQVSTGSYAGEKISLNRPQNFVSNEIVPVVIPELEFGEGATMDMYISHVTDTPAEFYCQLAANEASIDELMASVTDFYTENSPPATLEVGAFCVAQYSQNNAWYRAKILKISEEEGDNVDQRTVTVQFVDYGNNESVPPSQILGLNQNLGALAQQAVCCSLTDDLSLELSQESLAEFVSLDLEQLYRVTITSVLDNGRYVVELRNLDGTVLNESILNTTTSPSPTPSSFRHLSYAVRSTIDVYVSSVTSPTSFHCQPLELTAELENMMTEISETLAKESPPQLESVSEGLSCLAMYSEDEGWYRARIESVSDNGTDRIIAHFVDYGNSETTSLDSLRKCPDRFMREPIQALHCSVFEAGTADGVSWSEDKIEEFRAMLGEEALSLTVTSVDSERGSCVCKVSANGAPIDFTPLLPPLQTTKEGEGEGEKEGEGEEGLDRSALLASTSEIASLQQARQLNSDQMYASSASSSSLPTTGITTTTTDDQSVEHTSGVSTIADDVSVAGLRLGSSLGEPDSVVNASTLALRGSSHPSGDDISETESSEEVSDQGGGEGEPLIKAPFTLTLSIVEEFESTVVYVESPSCLYLQRTDCQTELEKLSSEIEQYCASFAEKQYQEVFQVGDFVLAQYSNDVWYRAKVVEVSSDTNIQVFFIDFGNTELILPEKMVMCPESYLELPCQAIACSLANVPHQDSWTDGYKDLIDNLVGDKTVRVKVVHPASKGMRPTVNIEIRDNNTDIAQAVLNHLNEECESANRNNFATYCEENDIEIVSDHLETAAEKTCLEERTLEIGESYNVYVLCCESPHSFFVRLVQEDDLTTSIEQALRTMYEEPDTLSLMLSLAPAVGDYAIAQFSEDCKWYRVRVTGLDASDPSKVEVLFIDYGNSEESELSKLRSYSSTLPTSPPYAIECFLAGVEPIEGTGSFGPEASEHFLEVTGHGKCVCKAEIKFADSAGHYGVNLFGVDGVNVAQSLFDAHLAMALQDTPTTAVSTSIIDDVTPNQSDPVSEAGQQPESLLEENPLSNGDSESKEEQKQVLDIGSENPSDQFATAYPPRALEVGTVKNAIITGITSLDEFHCQLTDDLDALEMLMANIASRDYQVNDGTLDVTHPQKGLPVCACFTEDDTWYRAVIVSVLSEVKVHVYFVDYGNSEELELSRVKHLEREFAGGLPPLILHCSLPQLTEQDLDPSKLYTCMGL